ncbi:MAG: SusC/RagA family TonB-linked outer membrane protein [Ferruginibacter sp.]|nr:SusC/RagA family TonB-linked outer membrane protein [Ferruginibacter sp.]
MFLCIMGSVALGQQKRTITGNVRDSLGSGLSSVSINVKGEKTATTSDGQGNFKITVPGQGAIVVFTSVGFQRKEVKVGSEDAIGVSMQNVSGQLNEVVVTGFGTRTNTRKLSYSVQEVKGEDISKANNPNIVNSLQGKVAGVMVNQGAGGPTSSSRIRIRGNTSISSGNTQPLFVVDGVLIKPGLTGADSWGDNQDLGNTVKNLNPDDYASFTILKGSAATALYGSDGQNGVILITTKKGIARKGLGVSFAHTETFDKAYKLYDLQNEYGSGTSPTFAQSGGVNVIDPALGAYFSFGPKFAGQQVKDLDGHMQTYQANDPLSFFQTGRFINTNIAMEGGNEKSTFRFSYSNLSNNAVTPNNSLGRNSFNLRATQKLGSIINMDVSINYTMSTSKNPVANGGNSNPLFAFTYSGTRSTDLNYYANNYIDTTLGGRKQGGTKDPYGLTSTFWNIDQQSTVQKESNLRANVDLTATVTPWLNFLVRANTNILSVDYQKSHRGEDAGFSGGSASYNIQQSNTNDIRLQGLLIANKQLNKDFSFTASAGGETNRSLGGNYSNVSTNGGFRVPDQYLISNSLNPPNLQAYTNPKKRTDALYAFGDITWKDMLTLSVSGRNDWNSTLTYQSGKGGYSYFYPSVGLAYVFTDMPSFKSKVISFGKLRGSYGYTGFGTDPYVTNSTGRYSLSGNTTSINGTLPVYTFNDATLPNLSLKNQLTKELEFGTELKFLDNRIGIDVAWYKKNTYNQIFNLPTASESGVGSRIINAGNIQNSGIEIVLTGTPIKTKDLQWNTIVNFTRNRNKIISLAPGVSSYQLELGFGADVQAVAIPGKDYGIVQTQYGFASYQKMDADGKPVANGNNGKKVIGDPAYADWGMTYLRNGAYDGSTKNLGTIMENYLLSTINSFSYKSFIFGFQVDAKVGGLMGSGTDQYGSENGSMKNSVFGRDAEHGGIAFTTAPSTAYPTGQSRNDGIIPDGVFQDGYKSPLTGADIGGLTYKQAYDQGLVKPKIAYQYYDDLYNWGAGIREKSIFENTWVALREISVGYNFPQYMSKKVGMNTLKISAVARNIMYLYKTAPDGINPEGIYTNRAAGFMEYGGYPYVRSIGVTLNASF